MKKGFIFLVLLFTLVVLSGCELVNEVIQNLNYQEIGDQNVIMQIEFVATENDEIEFEQTVDCYINREKGWLSFHAVQEDLDMYMIENEDDTISLYDMRENETVGEETFTGTLEDSEQLREYISSEFDFMNVTKMIDLLNKMVNDQKLTLTEMDSVVEGITGLKMYEATLDFSSISTSNRLIIDTLYAEYSHYNDTKIEDYDQKIILGLDGKEIKYLSYSQNDLMNENQPYTSSYGLQYTVSFLIKSVGSEADDQLNEIENSEQFPKK